jgi:putative intracellular protease/amidase
MRATLADALRAQGFALSVSGDSASDYSGAQPIKPVRAVVLSGKASAYPYYGYYALALTRLGISYRPVSGDEIAAGALDAENILVLPGGFSNWSLDAKEETHGADHAVRAFFAGGGAALASCGGAYYLAKGRPTWLGLADARPNITLDYLRTGVGITTCRIADGPLRRGLPPTLEIPYFHGPAFDEIGDNCRALAHFRDLVTPGRLFIDNPLTPETFAEHMQNRIAVLSAEGPRGRAVLFSPHPEMGDLLAKYMLLERYIPHYLPIRGEQVMRETLTAARPEQSRSFLLVLNAIEMLAADAREARPAATPGERSAVRSSGAELEALAGAWRARSRLLAPSGGGMGDIERFVLAGLERRLPNAVERLSRVLDHLADGGHDGPRLAASFATIAVDALAAWESPAERRPAELLLELELAVLLIEATATAGGLHIIIEGHV